jgi:hypothetical protein
MIGLYQGTFPFARIEISQLVPAQAFLKAGQIHRKLMVGKGGTRKSLRHFKKYGLLFSSAMSQN